VSLLRAQIMKDLTSFFAPKKRVCDDASDPSIKKKTKGDDSLPESVKDLLEPLREASWKEALSSTFHSSSFAKLAEFIKTERKNQTIYPPPQDVWNSLAMPLQDVRVVIVGQDPYHGPGQAHGLCFSVRHNIAIPPSLRNIYKELHKTGCIDQIPSHGCLEKWATQGVLMLNTVMSVRKGQANSHKNKGWEQVTDAILRAVIRRKGPCVFLLWGKPAAKKIDSVIGQSSHHIILSSSHPSPLGATKTKQPFTGSNCFVRCNDALKKMGKEPIDWNV